MVISLADYRVLWDGSFTVEELQGKMLTTPAIIHLADTATFTKPFIAFKVRPLTDTVRFTVSSLEPADGELPFIVRSMYEHTSNSRERGILKVLHESFSSDLLFTDQMNRISFQVIEGRCEFADVILHFQQRRDFMIAGGGSTGSLTDGS